MEFNVDNKENASIIELKGSLLADIQSRDILQQITDLIQDGHINFVVDLGELKFINSSGLGMLLTGLTKARKAGGEMILANVPEQVSNLLIITKLNSIFGTADSVDAAMANF